MRKASITVLAVAGALAIGSTVGASANGPDGSTALAGSAGEAGASGAAGAAGAATLAARLGSGRPIAAAAKRRCHPSYRGRCLKRNASDYDCAGGGGNGPYYVRGPFRVVGSDPYRLDADHDGIACE